MQNLFLGAAALAATLFTGVLSSHAETTECTEIISLPTVITAQGVYCLKKNLVTNITSGNAITINTNNVTIDFNGWKLGGAAAGPDTQANGVFANGRKNITLRNGNIRGFSTGVWLDGAATTSSGHVVEDSLIDGSRSVGLRIEGSNTKVVNNRVINTGPGSDTSAIGIQVRDGNGIHVEGNTVSGVEETNVVFGIFVDNPNDVEVRNNRVFDLKTATSRYGITAQSSDRIVIVGNSVTTSSGGTRGIGEFSSSTAVACVNNQVTGFTSNFSGCDIGNSNTDF